ncbi:MAG: carboxylesterase family protein [Terracidiphilus sp.]|nr:carboxylesterase family protein [Terracidiphilus sp.]
MLGRACALGAVVLVGMVLGTTVMAQAGPLAVKTQQGKVQGKTINAGKVHAFLGLPYAAPPVGELRWKAPKPPVAWTGVRDATKFGHHCVQGRVFDDMVFPDAGPSEDCLVLNVYTPATAKAGSKLPVMFWIHGGGYTGGAGSEPRHDGSALPTHGVVLVTINYRLGVLGFLATEDLLKEGDGHAGNYGMLDMVAALKWVRGNIAGFGGDPGNVTIFGESAGSFAVSTLMASPLTRGLFQKAIGESGGAFNALLPTSKVENRAREGQKWVAELGVKDLAELRAMSAEKLIEAAKRKDTPHASPVVDGSLLTEPEQAVYAAGKQAHVPLLAGWNRDENAGLAKGMTAAKWKTFAAERFGAKAEEFLKAYPGANDEEAVRSATAFGGDQFIAFGTWKWIEAQVKTGGEPVYRYHFELGAPASKFNAAGYAFHSDDIAYVFGALESRVGAEWRAEDRRLSEQMIGYWTNFARTGDPNGKGLPVWPRYDKTKELIHLDSTITVGADGARRQYEFLLKEEAAR